MRSRNRGFNLQMRTPRLGEGKGLARSWLQSLPFWRLPSALGQFRLLLRSEMGFRQQGRAHLKQPCNRLRVSAAISGLSFPRGGGALCLSLLKEGVAEHLREEWDAGQDGHAVSLPGHCGVLTLRRLQLALISPSFRESCPGISPSIFAATSALSPRDTPF